MSSTKIVRMNDDGNDKLQNPDLGTEYPVFSLPVLDELARLALDQSAPERVAEIQSELAASLPRVERLVYPPLVENPDPDLIYPMDNRGTEVISRLVDSLGRSAEKVAQKGKVGLLDRLIGLLPGIQKERQSLQGIDTFDRPEVGALARVDNPLLIGSVLERAKRAEEISGEGKDEKERVVGQPEESGWWGKLAEKFLPSGWKLPEFFSGIREAPWKTISGKMAELFGKKKNREVFALGTAGSILGKEVYDVFFGREEKQEKEKTFYEKLKSGLWSVAKIATLVTSLYTSRGLWQPVLGKLVKGAFDFFGRGDLYEALGSNVYRFGKSAVGKVVEFGKSLIQEGGVVHEFFEFIGLDGKKLWEKHPDGVLRSALPRIPDAMLLPGEGGVDVRANLA